MAMVTPLPVAFELVFPAGAYVVTIQVPAW
jgi:hypothetical protein